MNLWETGLLFPPGSHGWLHWEPFQAPVCFFSLGFSPTFQASSGPRFLAMSRAFPGHGSNRQVDWKSTGQGLAELSPEDNRAQSMSALEKQVWETWLVGEPSRRQRSVPLPLMPSAHYPWGFLGEGCQPDPQESKPSQSD